MTSNPNAENSDMESVKAVEDQAAAWLVRRDAGRWSDADQAALDRWLQTSTAHVVAFVRLETAWQRTHRLKALDAGLRPSSPLSRSREKAGVRVLLPLAASILVALAATVWHLRPSAPAYRTPIGGIATVPLSDGSKIILNTDSEIRLAVTETERHVRLDQGEAFFEVAKDPLRPFVVSAGNRRVIAVGTAFSVRRDKDDIQVVVTEGKVRIEDGRRDDVLLLAGSIARSGQDRVTLQQQPVARAEEALTWRTGFLTFRETSLADAVAEFNRYSTRQIVIGEAAAMESIRLSGRFQSTQYEAFIRLLEDSFPIRADRRADRILLLRR
jgi:transmembrane sensor